MIHCPSCSSELRFDIEEQMMVCDHCDMFFSIDDIRNRTKDDAKESEIFDAHIYVCPSCGAELLTYDKNDAIGFCPYCGGSSMLYDRVRKDWAPDYVIPFKITKEEAKKAYLKEVKKHPFVSSKYADPEQIESFKGIYMPYWYFEGKQEGSYIIQNTTTRIKDNEEIIQNYDNYYRIDYRLRGYDHDASLSFDDHISERLAPYSYGEREVFHPGYLSGFYAEIGDADAEEYQNVVTAKMEAYTKNELEKRKKSSEAINIPAKITKLENALHPVWFMSYRHKGKITYAAVNGATGKVAADLPLSPLKLLLTSAGVSTIIFGVIAILMAFLPSVTANAALLVCSIVTALGMYFLFDSYIGTVFQCVGRPPATGFDSDKLQKRFGFSRKTAYFMESNNYFIPGVCGAAMVLGAVMIVTDGSYSQSRARFGYLLFLPSIILFIICIVKQFEKFGRMKTDLSGSFGSQLENSLIETSHKYNSFFAGFQFFVYLAAVIVGGLAFMELFGKEFAYILCGVMGALIILTACLHIRFQSTVAKRIPTQLNKKGAFYDEK